MQATRYQHLVAAAICFAAGGPDILLACTEVSSEMSIPSATGWDKLKRCVWHLWANRGLSRCIAGYGPLMIL